MLRAGAPLAAGAAATVWLLSSGEANFVAVTAPQGLVSSGLRGSAAPRSTDRGTAGSAAVTCLGAAVAATGAIKLASSSRRSQVVRRATEAAAPVKTKAEPLVLSFDPRKEPGVTLPLMYFDPAGFAKVGDRQGFYNLRSAELKHGRVAMIASFGAVLQHWFRFPGFEGCPPGLSAVLSPPATFGLVAFTAACGALEFTIFKQDPDMDPGDFGDPAGLGQYYTEWKDRELNNGRMAMLSVLGIFTAELVTGRDGIDQLWQPLGDLKVE